MLKNILELLPHVKITDGEYIAIAKGANKLPETIKEFKNQIKWQSRKK
jgi:hypothetical protein